MSLFGYFGLGLRAMSAAQLGLQVAGDNISNATTPGYARRRLDLTTGYPVRVPGGMLDQGVQIDQVRRQQDRLIQAALERETGTAAFADERLRGLRELESVFGTLDGDGILSAYADFSDAFTELAAQPENLALRRNALSGADRLASRLRDASNRLLTQRRAENDAVAAAVEEVNGLAAELAALNRKIAENEADGTTASPLRDQRDQVVERLVELTGGTAVPAERGQVSFSLPAGTTLVSVRDALPLRTSRDAQGMLRIAAGGDGSDITARFRSGKVGALLAVRDDEIPARLADLNDLAQDLIDRANALTTGATDLDGNPGRPLFIKIPPVRGAAEVIRVNVSLLDDPRLLAVSTTGAPGDGWIADRIGALREGSSAALGNTTPADYLAGVLSDLGAQIVEADVASEVSRDVVGNLHARRESVSGVSLDEEAVELIRHQRAYEAGARFLQILNEITEITVNLV